MEPTSQEPENSYNNDVSVLSSTDVYERDNAMELICRELKSYQMSTFAEDECILIDGTTDIAKVQRDTPLFSTERTTSVKFQTAVKVKILFPIVFKI